MLISKLNNTAYIFDGKYDTHTYRHNTHKHMHAYVRAHKHTHIYTGLILGLCPANERRRYKVTPSLIGWAQTYNQPCIYMNRWKPPFSFLLFLAWNSLLVVRNLFSCPLYPPLALCWWWHRPRVTRVMYKSHNTIPERGSTINSFLAHFWNIIALKCGIAYGLR